MNRRDLFRGAGAMALASAVPEELVVAPWTAPRVDAGTALDALLARHRARTDEAFMRALWNQLFRHPHAEPRSFDGLTVRTGKPLVVFRHGPGRTMFTQNVYTDPIQWPVTQDPRSW